LVTIMHSGKPDSARVAAAQALLDRGWGKPSQAIEHQGDQRLFPRGFFAAFITGDPAKMEPGA
jgi:hypothetical protein